MKKLNRIVVLLALCISAYSWGQTTSPPVYNDDDQPIDLAVEKAPAVKKQAPKPKQPAVAKPATEATPTTTATIPAPVTPPPEAQPAQAPTTPPAPVSAPTPTPPVTSPPAEAVAPSPAPTPVPAPVTAPITPTLPATAPAEIVPPPINPPDGAVKRDAGMDISTSMPVTFDKYDDNSLSSQDTTDVFKLYGRNGEGVGIILIPKSPTMQLSVALLGESGELLSQTQAPQPGAPLSFQTSPLDRNRIIYIQVKDANLPANAPATELRQYSLELKPIAPPPPPPPVAPVAVPQPSAEPQQVVGGTTPAELPPAETAEPVLRRWRCTPPGCRHRRSTPNLPRDG